MAALRIGFLSSEVAPLAKTGGLADVAAALPAQLARLGHDVRLVMPLYRRLREAGRSFTPVAGLERLEVSMGRHTYPVRVLETRIEELDLPVWCLDCPPLYDREGIYTPDPDEHLRFAVLGRGALAAFQALGWSPDVVHCNDWHVALVPLYLRLLASWETLFAGTRTVLTVHNLGYQGVVGAEALRDLGLDDAAHLLHQEDLAAGRINFLKTGILYADVLSTVSRTYAREIQTEALGMGLDDLLRTRSDRLVGIVNGIDAEEWDPATDPHIPVHYTAETLDDKRGNRDALLSKLGMAPAGQGPVFGIVSRLVGQKGLDLLFKPLAEMLNHHDARLAVVGSGEARYEEYFTALQRSYPGKVCFFNGYSNELAHLVEAGADAFLMPSRYEPCGLNQLYSLRYGTVPVVHRTGGLADTVQLFDPDTGEGTGILFDDPTEDAVRWALAATLELFAAPRLWRRMVLNGMAQEVTWETQVELYVDLYRRLLATPA